MKRKVELSLSQEKDEHFSLERLLPELITLIAHHLDKTDEPQSAKSERRQHFSIFRAKNIQTNRILTKLAQYAAQSNIPRIVGLLEIRPDLRLQVLFTLAGLGAQDEMRLILTEHPEDLLVYGRLRDISTAEFERITLFQHAVWAKDVRYMAPMMLDCLPYNEKGENVRMELLRQYNELMNEGVSYSLHGVKHERKHYFDLKPLLDTLRTYADNYNHSTDEEKEQHWCQVVGLAQTLLPAHIRHHYCDPDVSFCDNPEFDKPDLKRSLALYNWVANESQMWNESFNGHGSDFAVCTHGGVACCMPTAKLIWHEWGINTTDLTALTLLDKVRTDIDLPALEERLKTPIYEMVEAMEVQDMSYHFGQ